MEMSSGFKTSSMPTMADTETLPSLILSAAMCEWQSIMPGITNLPETSTTVASAGTLTFSPTSAILPSRMRIDPVLSVPLVTVRTVAFCMTMGGAASIAAANAPARSMGFIAYLLVEHFQMEHRQWELGYHPVERQVEAAPPPART